jgi:hypothetical protein
MRQTGVMILKQARTLYRLRVVDRSLDLCYSDGGDPANALLNAAGLAVVICLVRWANASAQERKQMVQGGKDLPVTGK